MRLPGKMIAALAVSALAAFLVLSARDRGRKEAQGMGTASNQGHRGSDDPRKPETVTKTDAEWRHCLTPEQFRVTRQKGTEPPFSGQYVRHKEDGTYLCVGCRQELFDSETKFDSGTGWPSFYAPRSKGVVRQTSDTSHGMVRTEVLCGRCGAHLGHVFDDGPAPTGLRYCVNSVALDFQPAEADNSPSQATSVQTERTALFGAGCFWGVEAAFREVKGVIRTAVGFSGGRTENPTYKEVCRGTTGHAEVVQVTYVPGTVSYGQLLDVFWDCHDPTQLNRQGPDVGEQYRSVIFFSDEDQERVARQSLKTLQESGRYSRPIVTQILPAPPFYRAEDYHQQYLEKRGLRSCRTR